MDAALREVALIQQQQVNAALASILLAAADISTGVETLIGTTSQMAETASALTHEDESGMHTEDSLRRLTGGLDSVLHLLASASDVQGSLNSATASIGAALNNYTEVLADISHSMRLVSLNVQVRAAHAGDLRTLNVLGEHARLMSEETFKNTRGAAADFEKLTSALENGSRNLERLHAVQQTEKDRLMRDSAGFGACVREQQRKSAGDVDELVRHCKAMADESSALLGRIQFGVKAEQLLKEIADGFAAQAASGDTEVTDIGELRALLDALKRNYTMDSEREIHQATVGESVDLTASQDAGELELF